MNAQEYIQKFGDLSKLDRRVLLAEMDRIWDSQGLNNQEHLSLQGAGVANFYSHPVWQLNGLFSEYDPTSNVHRKMIVSAVNSITPNINKIADFGGGSGYLAKLLIQSNRNSIVDVIEPFPSEFFIKRLAGVERIRFLSDFSGKYDLVIAQDVLEHVDNPIELSLRLVEVTKLKGYLIFANCFYPDIKCHLPSTFYLRYQFKNVMTSAGLKYKGIVPGVPHAQIFQRWEQTDKNKVTKATQHAKLYGPTQNNIMNCCSKLKNYLFN